MTISSQIETALDAGHIYKVDFANIKNQAQCDFEKDITNNIRGPFFHNGAYESRTKEELTIENILGFPNIGQFPSNKLMKAMSKAEIGKSAFLRKLCDLIVEWSVVGKNIRSLKEIMITGRKPSSIPRTTAIRTIENTGTCSVCNKNVKLDGVKIVAHGFTIRYGSQQGSCPGVGQKPIELSADGAIRYLNILLKYKITQEELLETVSRDERWDINGNIKSVNYDIKRFTFGIRTWKKMLLPGENLITLQSWDN